MQVFTRLTELLRPACLESSHLWKTTMTNKPNPAKPGSDEPFEPYPDTSPQQDDAPEHPDHPEDGGKPA